MPPKSLNQKIKRFLYIQEKRVLNITLACLVIPVIAIGAQNSNQHASVKKTDNGVEVVTKEHRKMFFEFYRPNIFRLYSDPKGSAPQDPITTPPAKIVVSSAKDNQINSSFREDENNIYISSEAVKISFSKSKSTFSIIDLKTGKVVLKELSPLQYNNKGVTQTLSSSPNEYFYGGGSQNGRFSHKGQCINIVNENDWLDGGVASPNPFFWSTNGYGILRNTFSKGYYDFGKNENNAIALSHEGDLFDAYYMINDTPAKLLNDYYILTGNPVLLPKFAFYQGHLNAYNRDYWAEVNSNENGAILFEDGKYYKEYNPVAQTFADQDNHYVEKRKAYEETLTKYKEKYGRELEQQYHESLNPQNNNKKNNEMFTAQAAVNRYADHDMPLGWFLPNDGYGAGYGQTGTLEGNIKNLKTFGDYARKKGVEIGLWTQSDLETENKEGVAPLMQRSISKEIGTAGVRVLKTDVAWVGPGYSFGLNGIEEAASKFITYGHNARPFIVTLDGWAGSQRYAGIWTGDQKGGEWSYIDFEIPTYIGNGLSGQPNVGSDMDGIWGGKNPIVNVRDFQWKTFTPIQMNMDGWGTNPKYPHILGEPAASINRSYLKLKSMLMPYTYSIASEATQGLPMIRAMFLEETNPFTLGKSTEYQFMYGPYFLIAPMYKATGYIDKGGNDKRDNIYLPSGSWIDFFSGERYEGGKVINDFNAPIWKLPIFIKNGAIIPLNNPNNNPSQIDNGLRIYDLYPMGKTSFTEYDDDGRSIAYKSGESTHTRIELNGPTAGEKGVAKVIVNATEGNFSGFKSQKNTLFKFNLSEQPTKVSAQIGNTTINLSEVYSLVDLMKKKNGYFYDKEPNLNNFATKGSSFEQVKVAHTPILYVKIGKTDISKNAVSVTVDGFIHDAKMKYTGADAPNIPNSPAFKSAEISHNAITLAWEKAKETSFYEILFEDVVYSTIKGNEFKFTDLKPQTKYMFKLRAVNNKGYSNWSEQSYTTAPDPLTFAIKNIKAITNIQSEEGNEIGNLLDFNDQTLWHSAYGNKKVAPWKDNEAKPAELILDLNGEYSLDRLEYLPRREGSNGRISGLNLYESNDGKHWTEIAKDVKWSLNNTLKVLKLDGIKTRYLKLEITEAGGGFLSGLSLNIFRKVYNDGEQDLTNSEKPVTSFFCISDVHLRKGCTTCNEAYDKGLENIKKIDQNASLINLGDMTDYGSDEEFKTVYTTIDNYFSDPSKVFCMLGNHDVRSTRNWTNNREEYKKNSPNSPYEQEIRQRYLKYNAKYRPGDKDAEKSVFYSKIINGIKFIILNTDEGLKDCTYFGPEQIAWLKAELKSSSKANKPIFVINHQALNNTHWRSNQISGFGEQDAEVKQILNLYPNVFYISGHIHNGFGVAEIVNRPFGVTVDIPSCLHSENGILDNGQAYYVKVYPNYVLFEAWNIITGEHLANYDLRISLPTLPQLYKEATDALKKQGKKKSDKLVNLVNQAKQLLELTYDQSAIAHDYNDDGIRAPKEALFDSTYWQKVNELSGKLSKELNKK